jgi:hypothetical protein
MNTISIKKRTFSQILIFPRRFHILGKTPMAERGPLKGMAVGRLAARAGNEVSSTARFGRKKRVILATGLFVLAILPIALIFLLLSLPVPSIRRLPAKTVALTIAASFFLITAIAWHKYASEDLSGFRRSLENIPPSSRVLGLDLVKSSEIIKGRPFLQLFAYAQVFKGCELNFSFAEHFSGLVAYKAKREASWTPGLEWFGAKVKRTDFAYFDYVLANGEEKGHASLSSFRELAPMTNSGRWRLYKMGR